MMKKFIMILILGLNQPHEYVIKVNDDKIQPFWNIVHGEMDKVSVQQYKEVMVLIEAQVLAQSKEFHLQDSLNKK